MEADAFRIGPEDVLDVQVWKNAELSRIVPVRPDGMISLPLVNDIQASGLTPTDLRQQITQRLAEFVPSPEVSVIVREVHSVKVAVLGAVRMPGHYEVKSPATVLDMIARAQGLTEFADRGRIVVLRQNGGGHDPHALQLSQGRRRVRAGQLLRAPWRHHRRSVRETSMSRDPLSPTADDSLALRVVEIVRRRKLIAVTAFATVLAAAVAFALYLPDLYRATALVLVERSISESIVRTPVSGELESRLYVIKQEILSRERLIELIDRFNLYPELRQQTGIEDVLSRARNDIIVQPAGPEQVSGRTKTVSFTLSYTSDNRETVAEVTNAVAAFYVQQNDRMRSEEAIRTTQFLRTQLAEAKHQLDRHEAAMRAYTTRYTGELPQQVGVNLATLERLNTQLRLNGEQQIRIIEQRDRALRRHARDRRDCAGDDGRCRRLARVARPAAQDRGTEAEAVAGGDAVHRSPSGRRAPSRAAGGDGARTRAGGGRRAAGAPGSAGSSGGGRGARRHRRRPCGAHAAVPPPHDGEP